MSSLLKAPRGGGAPGESAWVREGEVLVLGPPEPPLPQAGDAELLALAGAPDLEEPPPEEPPAPSPEELREQVLEEARAAAEAIRDQALAEAVAVREDARRQGLAQGRDEAAREAERLHAELLGLREDWERQIDRFRSEMEPALVGLAFDIARKVIQYEIESDHPVAVETARACLQRVRDAGVIKMQVNPRDLESVLAAREELKAAASGVSELQVMADRRVDRGGCLVETSRGYWDARIRPQLARVRTALTGKEEHEAPGPE